MKHFKIRVAAAAGLAAAFLVATPAHANVPSGKRDQYQKVGTGYQAWDGGKDLIRQLKVDPNRNFARGRCLDSWFDWTTNERPGPEGGRYHFDGRVVRTCNSHYGYGRSFDDKGKGRELRGMQKAATCYGPEKKTTASEGNCHNAKGHAITATRGRLNADLPNRCTQSWRVTVGSKTPVFHSGGSSKDCRG